MPTDNFELILKVLKESCMLGTNKNELLEENITHPRYWVALNGDKVIGLSGYYFDPNETDAVWAGWTAVERSLGMLSAKAANGLIAKVVYEARKTGRKYIRLFTCDLPEEIMANKIYDKLGFAVYKRGIDWDGIEIIYKQAQTESVYDKFEKNR